MSRLLLFGWIADLMLAIVLMPGTASAQEADTLRISGTFAAPTVSGVVGDDLWPVYANGHDHTWTLTLHGVSSSHDYYYDAWDDWSGWYGYYEMYVTRVSAKSFNLEFFGPDSDLLNSVVSQQLASGSLPQGGVLDLVNGYYFDGQYPESSGPFSTFDIGLWPLNPEAGVRFTVGGNWDWSHLFSNDEYGYPVVEAQRLEDVSVISDNRPGNGGRLEAPSVVEIGEPPVFPPTLSIADGSVLEGNKGTNRLNLTVTLSKSSIDVVTVSYATRNGTALATSDYTATSGTLTYEPGETSRTITIPIKSDRKREPDETFSVQLSSAVLATIDDGFATATIVNDD